MIVSDEVFMWFNTVMIAGIVIVWGARDLYLLSKLWKERREKHDEFFGSLMGLVIVTIGAIGLFKYHQSL
jgi:hypothetical protein